MRLGALRRIALTILVVVLATGTTHATTAGAAGSAAVKLRRATLSGAGSTLQLPFDQMVIAQFAKVSANARVTINYFGTGSGAGRQQLIDGGVDFAGSDVAFSAAEAAELRGPVLYFPTVVAAIAVTYTLSGVDELQLSGPTIAKIFQRQITTWNDPTIMADNPGVSLPSTAITVIRRGDDSGVTQHFSAFLAKADPAGWKLGVGGTVPWPADTQRGQGDAGVANLVKATNGAIGYVDSSDAKAAGLASASIRNQLGKYVAPSAESAAAAAAATVTVDADLTYDPIYAPGAASYPITAPTYIVVARHQPDPAKAAALRAFLTYVETAGQKAATKIDFAPLVPSVAKKARAQIAQIEG